eukprot:jgi/Mesen1/4473/ME000228S03452
MVDIAPILEEAERRLSTSSVKERVGIFEASLASAIDQQDNNFPERAGEVVSLIFKTLPLYTDRRSQSSVERAIVKALKRDSAFVKTFTGGLIQYTSKSGKTAGADVQLKLLKWSCLLLRTNPDLFSVKAAFARLAGAQAVLLTGLLKSAVRIQRSALHAFLQLLNQVAPAFELYMGEVKATPVTFDSIGMVSALLSHCTSSSSSSPSSSAAAGADGTSSLLDGTKGAFLEIYIKAVLSSKEKPPVEASRAFKPLLQRLGHDEFAATVVPTAVRMLKRNPELVMEAVGEPRAASRTQRYASEGKGGQLRVLSGQTSDPEPWKALIGGVPLLAHIVFNARNLASLAEPLVQLAKAGLTKPAQRVEGIYALLLAASIAADDIAAGYHLSPPPLLSPATPAPNPPSWPPCSSP